VEPVYDFRLLEKQVGFSNECAGQFRIGSRRVASELRRRGETGQRRRGLGQMHREPVQHLVVILVSHDDGLPFLCGPPERARYRGGAVGHRLDGVEEHVVDVIVHGAA